MTDNPYTSPISDSGIESSSADEEPLGRIGRRVFLAWEKLRLVYIGILAAVTIAFVLPDLDNTIFAIEFWSMGIFGAIGANVCYFIGPAIETYVTWLGYRGKWLRWILFQVGTVFSSLLVSVVLWLHLAKPIL